MCKANETEVTCVYEWCIYNEINYIGLVKMNETNGASKAFEKDVSIEVQVN